MSTRTVSVTFVAAALARALLVAAVALVALVAGTASADAQQTCESGSTLVGDFCVTLGDPPVQGPDTCPELGDPGACYFLTPFLSDGVTCPNGSVAAPSAADPQECRRPQANVPGPLLCTPPFMLDGTRCIRLVPALCIPPACVGSITLTYSVECVGEGRARVVYGEPRLENGARVSLTTLNGSANIGAEVPGGSSISVAVTAVRPTDLVEVNGPATAPPCGASTPTPQPAPTSTPGPIAQPAANATPTPAPTATPTPEATTLLEPTATPTPEAAAAQVETPPAEPTATVPPPPACPAGEALIEAVCLPPCSSGRTPCYDVSATGVPIAADPTAVDEPGDDDGGAPVVTLALIGGATVVLSTVGYARVNKRT